MTTDLETKNLQLTAVRASKEANTASYNAQVAQLDANYAISQNELTKQENQLLADIAALTPPPPPPSPDKVSPLA